ncbi:hypothetical protein DSO57_1023739 [Entomophthora muscae]|uniref:Uncharacterized protein n=1 Tax=Entomophthora muscae TaxID=34485 RepID=A0ACC2RHG1_9FUNG|nr:hypothetical protein DSO57_1023739 [Entomophthora muscae]
MVTVETAPESPANWNNATNSVEFDLEIHNEFPTSNNEPIDTTSAEDNVIDGLPQVNNVYNGETTDVYINTPMETSPVVPPGTTLNTPMDTFNTPVEMGLVDNNDPRLTNRAHPSTMNDEPKHAIPGIHRHPQDAPNLKMERLVEGISVDKLFVETAVTISLADLLWESPKLRQKSHRAVSALQLHWKEELFLVGTGAPRTEAAVNKQMTHNILDGGAYSNLITAKFLETLPNVFIAPSDVTFIMADGSEKFCLGIAKGLNLWISGAEIQINTAIFGHHKYTLLFGQQTLTDLGITTQYIGNKWTIEYNNLKVQLQATFDTPQITEFLSKPIETNISKNK